MAEVMITIRMSPRGLPPHDYNFTNPDVARHAFCSMCERARNTSVVRNIELLANGESLCVLRFQPIRRQ